MGQKKRPARAHSRKKKEKEKMLNLKIFFFSLLLSSVSLYLELRVFPLKGFFQTEKEVGLRTREGEGETQGL